MIQTLFWVCSFSICAAQTVENDTNRSFSAISNLPDSLLIDSLMLESGFSDSTLKDSLTLQETLSDSTAEEKTMRISPNAVTSIVDYFAEDSVEFDVKNKKTLLYANTVLLYEDLDLQSHYVEIDFNKNELHAEGFTDTNETLQGTPVFKQGEFEFKSHELDYNFTSKKGLIRNVITQEGEGFLHGKIVKKNEDNTCYIRHGKYTTCNLEHPHYEIRFGKGKVIPNDKIVTGPLHVRIANIPTFLALPFAMFPNSNKRTNGLLPPGFESDNNLGIYFKGLGYYFAIKDVVDFAIRTDIYMQKAFGANLISNYVVRYKCSGGLDIKYQLFPNSKPDTKDYMSNSVHILWRHTQDRKAHPRNTFSANVNFQTSDFKNKASSSTYETAIQSVTQSSISFSTSFKNRYSLGINANISQNLTTKDLGLDLPQINFNIQQFYPFRKKKTVGKLRWYEEISMQYTTNLNNGLHTTDTLLFKHFPEAIRLLNSELSQSIPIRSTIKLFKYISWNNSVSFNEIWNMKGFTQAWQCDSIVNDTLRYGSVHRDTSYNFYATHNLTLSTDLSTTLYGMYMMKKGRVYAFRHTFMPSIGFSYSPYLNKMNYRTYYDSTYKKEVEYNIVNKGIGKTSARINFSLNNKLEMKVRKKKKDDDEEEFKKVTLLESFSISTFYDFMRDSLRLDPIRITGRTLLFKYINLGFSLDLDPYSIDTISGSRCNITEWQATHKRLFRASSTAWDVNLSLNLNKNFFKSKNKETTPETTSYGFKDWNVSVSYSFRYNMNDNMAYYNPLKRMDTLLLKYTHTFNNVINISGNISLTPKWDLGFKSGYDFTNKQISYSEFYIERDLHCWRIKFAWKNPFGKDRFFGFYFEPKASILKDIGNASKVERNISD